VKRVEYVSKGGISLDGGIIRIEVYARVPARFGEKKSGEKA